jgi:putative SOS response-associated peptidase YedK
MCNRYSIMGRTEEIASRFEVDIPSAFYKQNFNAAPSQLLPVITLDSSHGLSLFYWGLPPERSKNRSITERIINTRKEAIEEKTLYKKALKLRRCLILADGYYEWKKIGKKSSIPYRVVRQDRGLFAFAGIWEEYEEETGDNCHTFSIITTVSNPLVATIHDRMPVILSQQNEKIWLDKNATEQALLAGLTPYPGELMEVYTVSPRINSPQFNDATLLYPAPAADQHGNLTLFD